MPSKTKYDIKELMLDEISLVDNPANVDATVALWKRADDDAMKRRIKEYMDKGMSEDDARSRVMRETRKDAGSSGEPNDNQGDIIMDVKQLGEKLEDLEKQVEQLTAERDEAVAKSAAAEEALSEVTKKSDEPEMIEFGGEMIEKSAVPAPVLKQLEAQAEVIAKMASDKEAEDLRKRADAELPNLGGSDDVRGKLLKAADGIEGATALLKAADAAMRRMTTEKGFTAAEPNSALDELDQLAKKYAADKSVSYASAYAEVTKSGRGLELFQKRHVQ